MLIAISGAQSTGKTTVIRELEKLGYDTMTEITRNVAAMGCKINEEGTDETQLLILNEHIRRSNIKSDDVIVLDRSILDGVVYTHYLYNENKIQKSTLDKYIQEFEKTLDKYSLLFYIKPEFDIIDDGQRSTDTRFRNEVVALFEYYIEQYSLDVVYLTGTVEERVNTLINNIK